MRILIVEDDKNIQKYYGRGLERKEVDFDIVDSRVDAIDHLKKRSYEGAIVDLQLTDDQSYSQGIEVLKYIETVNEETKAIVVSGTPNTQDIVDSWESGAVKAIIKSTKGYSEIAEEFADQCKDVKLHYFGRFPSLNAYLAYPANNSILWEDSLLQILKCGYQNLNIILNKSLNGYFPIIRPINYEASLVINSNDNVISGFFWSKGKGFPFLLAITKSNNGLFQGLDIPKDSVLIDEKQPIKDVIVKIWRLNNINRNEFYEFINDIGEKNE